ncbi:MAG: class I SAM-dependent methyltransferase [Acidimicrobiia bacterium]
MTRPSILTRLRARLGGTRAPQHSSGADQPADVAWQAAIDGEVDFWRRYLATKGERYPGSYDERVDPDLELQPDIAALVHSPEGATVKLLDVGAGPLTFLGRRSDRWTLELTAVDALGDQYRALLDEAGLTPPVYTQACESEKLTELLPVDTFDVVAARNTLDHSYDPVRAITEMLACAKPGGALYLVHHRNEAEREGYRGMHQWNFEAGDSSLVVWRPGTRTDLGAELAGRAVVERTWVDGTWEHVAIRKLP